VVRAARTQTETGDFAILVRDSADGPFRQVAEYANEDGGYIAGFVPDGTALWVASARAADLTRLVELDLGTGQERVIDADEEADLAAPVVSDKTGELLAAAYLVRDRLVVHSFDARFRDDWARSAAPPRGCRDQRPDAQETAWIVSFDDDRDPGADVPVDRTTAASQFLYRSRPWLDPATLAPVTPIAIPSAPMVACCAAT